MKWLGKRSAHTDKVNRRELDLLPTSSTEVGFKTNLTIWILWATQYLSAAITKLAHVKEGIFFSGGLIYQEFSFKAEVEGRGGGREGGGRGERERERIWLKPIYNIAMFLFSLPLPPPLSCSFPSPPLRFSFLLFVCNLRGLFSFLKYTVTLFLI